MSLWSIWCGPWSPRCSPSSPRLPRSHHLELPLPLLLLQSAEPAPRPDASLPHSSLPPQCGLLFLLLLLLLLLIPLLLLLLLPVELRPNRHPPHHPDAMSGRHHM